MALDVCVFDLIYSSLGEFVGGTKWWYCFGSLFSHNPLLYQQSHLAWSAEPAFFAYIVPRLPVLSRFHMPKLKPGQEEEAWPHDSNTCATPQHLLPDMDLWTVGMEVAIVTTNINHNIRQCQKKP